MGLGEFRLQAEGFPVLADRLLHLALLVEGGAKVVVDEPIVFCDFKRVPEQGSLSFQ